MSSRSSALLDHRAIKVLEYKTPRFSDRQAEGGQGRGDSPDIADPSYLGHHALP